MSLSIGIVGLPNVGKSTLFNALTKNEILAANFPFATIEPNVGIVNVPDDKLSQLAKVSASQRIVPATVTFVDIAGLVRGAAQGAGLGNKFLAHIRECSAIVQVVRAFEGGDVVHVDETVEPARDIETIRTELCLADIDSVQNKINRLQKEAKANPQAVSSIAQLSRILDILNAGKLLSETAEVDSAIITDLQLLTTKPMIYVFNIAEERLSDKAYCAHLRSLVGEAESIFLCAALEAQLKELDNEEKMQLLSDIGQDQSGLDALTQAGYRALKLQSYYTSGEKESRAWTIHCGDSAPQAAGVIHTDFERGFIKADVVSFDDFITNAGWSGARSAGKVRLEGRDYIMQADDVVEFKFNV